MSISSIAELRAYSLTRVNDGERLYVSGYYTSGDGGGGIFRYSASSSVADDSGSYIAPTSGTGRYIAIFDGPVNVKRFGAKGDGVTDDSAAIQTAVNSGLGPVTIPHGVFYCASNVNILTNNSGIIGTASGGAGVATSQLKFASGTGVVVGSTSGTYTQNAVVRDVDIESDAGSGYAITVACSRNLRIDSVSGYVRNFLKIGIASKDVTGCVDNGSGAIRITCVGHGLETGGYAYVNRVGGVSAAKGAWVVTRIDADTIDLVGSTFSGTYTSGGSVAPHVVQVYISGSSQIDVADSYAIDVYNIAGSVMCDGQVMAECSNGSPSSTVGIRFNSGTNAYDRVDYVKFNGCAFQRFGTNFLIDNTRVVSVEIDGTLLDGFTNYGFHIDQSSPDDTGGGCEDVYLANARFGLHVATQKTAIRIDASGVSVVDVRISQCNCVAYENGIEIVGGTSPVGVVNVSLTDNYVEMRPASGTRHGVTLSGYIAACSINGFTARKQSGAGAAGNAIDCAGTLAGSLVASGIVAVGLSGYAVALATGYTADVIVRDCQNTLDATKRVSDADLLAHVEDAPFTVGGRRRQCFMLQIQNNGGSLRHRIGSIGSESTLPDAWLISTISGATASYTATPTGTDASTAMAGGLKIGSASTNKIILDTASQPSALGLIGTVYISKNSTGTAVTAQPSVDLIDVNGVSQTRLSFNLYNAASGAAFAINTSNIPSGESIWISADLFIS